MSAIQEWIISKSFLEEGNPAVRYLETLHANPAKLDNLNMYLRVLMSAAETYFGSQMGQEKKQFVLDELKRNGIYFDEETVQDALEAMWRELCAEGILNTEEEYLSDEELEEE